MNTKECNTCLEVKKVEDFHKDKGMKDGYKNYCKACYKAKIYSYGEKEGTEKRKSYIKKRYYESPQMKGLKSYIPKKKYKSKYIKKGWNPISGKSGFIKKPKQIIEKNGVKGKECTRCGEWRPLTEYHKFRRQAYGLNIYCKPCDRGAKNQYFKTEKGKNTAHKAAAKRRAKKKGIKFTPYDRNFVLKRDKYKCQLCGIKVHDRSARNWNTPDKAHIDHIISLENGGTWDYGNLQTLCRTCNLEKGSDNKGEAQLSLF